MPASQLAAAATTACSRCLQRLVERRRSAVAMRRGDRGGLDVLGGATQLTPATGAIGARIELSGELRFHRTLAVGAWPNIRDVNDAGPAMSPSRDHDWSRLFRSMPAGRSDRGRPMATW